MKLQSASRLFLAVLASTVIAVAPVAAATFSHDVAPIFYRACVSCHRAGQAAPMSLDSYQSARPWAKSIRSRVADRSMPPWSADEGHRRLANERRLSEAEIKTIVDWVDEGALEGDAREAPPAPSFPDEWRIGAPDAVFAVPENVDIPAAGNLAIKYFVVPTAFSDDRWISAMEVRPSDPARVHHVIMYVRDASFGLDPPGRDATTNLGSSLMVYGPGADPVVFSDGIAKRLPARSVLIFEMHYTPNGTPGRDRTRLGLRLAATPPTTEIHGLSMSKPSLRIPARAASFEVNTRISYNESFRIISVMPHAHLRGKDFVYRLLYPDGHSEVILSVSKYSWQWQTMYVFADPVVVPARTVIEVVAHYDNSAGNRDNPDPTADVGWGWQPSEEMMFSYLNFIVDK